MTLSDFGVIVAIVGLLYEVYKDITHKNGK